MFGNKLVNNISYIIYLFESQKGVCSLSHGTSHKQLSLSLKTNLNTSYSTKKYSNDMKKQILRYKK